MELKERLHIGKVLIDMLEDATAKLNDPYDDELPVFIKRAIMIQLRMKRFYYNYEQPPELLEQISIIEGIVKRMTDLESRKIRR
jgi:hypothetical protein